MNLGKRNNQLKDSDVEKRELNFKIYFAPYMKNRYIRIYDILNETHDRTFETLYKKLKTNIDEVEAELTSEVENELFNNYDPDYFDHGNYADKIMENVYERLDEQFLMHYQFELMSLSNLYQVFEQQLRKWLYEEMTHRLNEYRNQVEFNHVDAKNKNAYDEFCTKFSDLTELISKLKLNFTDQLGNEQLIVESDIWGTIRECNLISNTYKHGGGHSANNLYKLFPQYFKEIERSRLMDFYRTTNLEQVLDVEEIVFKKYSNAMKKFWENMKEHQEGILMVGVRK